MGKDAVAVVERCVASCRGEAATMRICRVRARCPSFEACALRVRLIFLLSIQGLWAEQCTESSRHRVAVFDRTKMMPHCQLDGLTSFILSLEGSTRWNLASHRCTEVSILA